jgi:hypothetical protein
VRTTSPLPGRAERLCRGRFVPSLGPIQDAPSDLLPIPAARLSLASTRSTTCGRSWSETSRQHRCRAAELKYLVLAGTPWATDAIRPVALPGRDRWSRGVVGQAVLAVRRTCSPWSREVCRIWIPPRGLEGLGLRRVDAGQGSHRLSRVGSLQSWTRRTTSWLSTTAAHGSPRCRGGSSRLWVRQRLILSPLVSTLLDADDPVTKLAQYQGSYCVVPSVHSPMIN